MWHAHNLCQIFFCFGWKSPLLFTITKTEATAEKVFGKGSQNRCVEPKTAVNELSDRSAAPKTAVNEPSDRSAELKTAVNEPSDRSAAPKTAANEPSDRSAALKTAVNELSDRSATSKTAVNESSDRSAAPKTAVNESSDRSDRLKGGSKNSGFKFLPILMFSISADFRLFRCHFVKSHQSHSPLCSFFNLQKHTRQ